MKIKSQTLAGYRLFHNGALALCEVERIGFRIDTAYLKELEKGLSDKVDNLERKLWRESEAMDWKKVHGSKTNFDSPTQLSVMLFKHWGHTPTKRTRKDNPAVDDSVVRKIGTPFLLTLLERKKLLKIRDTYIAQLLRHEIDGIIHTNFNLNFVSTYRSSSDSPNLQNVPVRDPVLGPMIRKAFLPHRPVDQIVEIDYSGIEVRVSACYHQDPIMMEYIHDKTKDMHRDMAAQMFKLSPKEVSKKIRYVGKNGFVFPEFYGSYWASVAPAVWDMVDDLNLVTESGTPLRKHLKASGLKTYDRFEKHIQQVEEDFWGRRFRKYAKWKRDWYAEYLRRGFFDTLTGFRCQGVMHRNEAVNYPIQGSAFHCLLWSLIRLVNVELRKRKMLSRIIGQIHDSIIGNVVPGELEDYIRVARRVMTVLIKKDFPWLIVPLDVEVEAAPPGAGWDRKKGIAL